MDLITVIKAIPVIGGAVTWVSDWATAPEVKVTTASSFAQYDEFLDGPHYKPVDYRIRVENIGQKTAYGVRGNIHFHGVINPDDPHGTVTVDTTGVWEQKGNGSIALRGGDSEWLNILRVVQDYTSGRSFDSDTNVYLEFPTSQGWSQPSRIRKKWHGAPGNPSHTSEHITWKEAGNIAWQEARVEIIGEKEDSSAVSTTYDIDLPELQSQMDNRGRFFIQDDHQPNESNDNAS